MSDQLATIADLGVALRGNDDVEIEAGGNYLPRVQLMTDASKLVKKKEFPSNHFAMVAGTHEDLGEEIDVLLIEIRLKALDMNPEVPIANYDSESEAYKEIAYRADNVKESGCMHGAEFLIYLPAREKFAILYFGSKSGRRECKKSVAPYLQNWVTLKPKFIETTNYSWWTTEGSKCSTPNTMPTKEALLAAVEQFREMEKPKVDAAEKAEEPTKKRAR